ncbi:unnamed protein product [Schistosoma margrebowiei]|uniref:LIM zinc-binding domain-containing protein n=1 Tax=Schistosoma margrebowiei TaxID=48269 RepID=A0AA85ALT9_9TREM|nr:unnamed protein product [Schistosoma margrebowiei]
MLSSYQIPISNHNHNNNQKKKNEHFSRIISSSNSIGTLSSPRNNSSLITNSMNTNTILNNNTNNNSNIGVNTSRNNDYINGNESNGNYTTSSSILGCNSRIFSNCAECGLRIINLIDTCYAMGYLYHNSCFVCCCCKRTLRGKVFYKDQDKIYCEEDYLYCGFQQTVEKCFACGHIIAETILLAVGKTYHPGCFRCCICTKCLDGIPFTIDSNNLIYCLPDYHLINGPLCAVCGLVIMPDEGSNEVKRVVALGKEFHIDCYRCIDCKRNLGDEADNRCYPFNEPDLRTSGRIIQRLLCLNCHLQRIGAIPATSSGSGNIINTNNHHTNNTAVSGNHLKSNSGIISQTNTTPMNMINNTRYTTMSNRNNKLNTLNTNQYFQHHHHQHHPNHSHNQLNNISSSTLLTHNYTPTTLYTTRTIQYTTPNSITSSTSGLNHRNSNTTTTTTTTTNSSSSSGSSNNYAINWEKTRANGINNHHNHNASHSQYTNIH